MAGRRIASASRAREDGQRRQVARRRRRAAAAQLRKGEDDPGALGQSGPKLGRL
jgi:hypothetical protein